MFVVRGVKGWIVTLIALAVIIIAIVLVFQLFLFLLPLILIVIIISYLFRMLNKVKKGQPKDYIDIEFKEKNEPLSINQFQNVQGNNCR